MIFALSLLLALLPVVATTDAFEMANVFDPESQSRHSHAPHKCIHDKISKLITDEVEPQQYSIYAEAERKRQSTVPTAPLRIHFDTFNLGAQ
jgi:hypothetical protein